LPTYHPAIRSRAEDANPSKVAWTFFTNHGLVLLALAQDPRARLRDITDRVGITERAVRRIIGELVEGGYVSRSREGRRNIYVVHGERPLRHPMESHQNVAAMLAGLVDPTLAHVTKDTLR
jgi:DNA-binding MarR family transcriptional regulator